MNKLWHARVCTASTLAVSLCCMQIAPPLNAQIATAPIDRAPTVTLNSGFLRGEFRPGAVSSSDFRDSSRIGDLIRAGQLYLSLEDAIALALENNLDLEL